VLLLHYQSLKDLNENRLSKFEFALYIQKLLEFFLTDDVAFNYVEHFYSSDRFRPGYLPYRCRFACVCKIRRCSSSLPGRENGWMPTATWTGCKRRWTRR
jgi:hypothetical protein